MDSNVFQIIIFVFVYCTQIQSQSSDTYMPSGSSMVASVPSISPTVVPLASGPSISSTVVPLASGASISSTVVPLTSVPGISSTVVPLASGASISSTVVPLTSGASISSTVVPLASGASISSTVVPLTSVPSISSTVVPLASGASIWSTVVPLASGSSVSPTVAPLASGSSISPTVVPLASGPSVSPTIVASVPTGSNQTGNPSSTQPSFTSASSSSMTSQSTTSSIAVNMILTFKYQVTSAVPLQMGNITNNTILASVQIVILSTFSIVNFTITVTRIDIEVSAKATNQNDMFVDLLFQSACTNCDKTCIQNAASSSGTPNQNFQLPTANGALVVVTPTSSLIPINGGTTTTSAPINYQKGESPPGLAAQLGMGLGITFISVLLIAEIIYCYWKNGHAKPTRQSNYELPSQNRRLSD